MIMNGKLNLKMYGPSIYPALSKEVLATQSVPGKGWERSDPSEQTRRSVYIHIKRSLLVPMLSNFDFPDPDVSCEARFITTQPGQALGMLNSDFLHSQSEEFASRLKAQAPGNLEAQMQVAYRLALSHEPSADEIARGKKLIEDLQAKHKLTADKALAFFCLFVYNLNEFSYVD